MKQSLVLLPILFLCACDTKEKQAERHLVEGSVDRELADEEGAIADFTKAIELKPDCVEAYYNRGITKSSLGDQQGAIADLTKAIQLESDSAGAYSLGAYYHRGVARSSLGDQEGAIIDLTKAIQLKAGVCSSSLPQRRCKGPAWGSTGSYRRLHQGNRAWAGIDTCPLWKGDWPLENW